MFDSKGNAVEFAGKIGEGGEGSVHKIVGRSDVVAKVYHKPPSGERVQKLEAMVSLHTSDLAKLACWPTDILRPQRVGPVSGFLMPYALGYKEVFKLYNPKSRVVEFQDVHWGFLVRAAANMARAFATVHAAGHVIGDVNHASVFVASNATVRLIDCDSFQVRANGRQFSCEVGQVLFTPPELQCKPFKGITRTCAHDNFGLAVLIFELLFMGRHPFAGAFAGGDMSLEEKIRSCRFAYGPTAGVRQMAQPPNTLSLAAASPTISQLFEIAFSPNAARDGTRPTATEWVQGLAGLETSLRQCNRVLAHYYYSGLASCPWCELEAQTGAVAFSVAFAPVPGQGALNLALVWDLIGKVPCPADHPVPAANGLPRVAPSPDYARTGKKRRGVLFGGGAVSAILAVLAVLSPDNSPGVITVAIVLFLLVWAVSESISSVAKRAARENLNAVQAQFDSLVATWEAAATPSSFRHQLSSLEAKKSQYVDLPALRQREHQVLQFTIRDRQLFRYLDSFQIKPGQIHGVGPGRCATLASYGIDTAADVEYSKVRSIQGFGDQLSWNVQSWRAGIESRFVFNSKIGIDPRDIQKLDSDIASKKAALEHDLRNGANLLRQTGQAIEAARTSLGPQMTGAMKALALARANMRAV